MENWNEFNMVGAQLLNGKELGLVSFAVNVQIQRPQKAMLRKLGHLLFSSLEPLVESDFTVSKTLNMLM